MLYFCLVYSPENQLFNKFNIPVCDRTHQHTSHVFIEAVCNQTVVLMASLSDYHTYLEQVVKYFLIPL